MLTFISISALQLALACWLFFYTWRRGSVVLGGFLLVLLLHYVVLPLFGLSTVMQPPEELVRTSFHLTAYMLCFAFFGFALVTAHEALRLQTPREPGERVIPLFAVTYVASTVIAGLFGYTATGTDAAQGGVIGLASMFIQLEPFVFGALGYAYATRPNDPWVRTLLWGALSIKLGFALVSQFRGAFVNPILGVLAGYALGSGRFLRVAAILAGLVAVAYFVLSPFVEAMRIQTGMQRATLDDVFAAIARMYTLHSGPDPTKLTRDLSAWLMFVTDGGYIPERTFGDYLYSGLTAHLPSFLVPNKAPLAFGNEFGHMMHVLQTDDYGTNISPGVVTEGWMYDWYGMIAFAAIHASILYYSERVLLRVSAGMAVGLLPLLNSLAESPFAHAWVGTLKLIVLMHVGFIALKYFEPVIEQLIRQRAGVGPSPSG